MIKVVTWSQSAIIGSDALLLPSNAPSDSSTTQILHNDHAGVKDEHVGPAATLESPRAHGGGAGAEALQLAHAHKSPSPRAVAGFLLMI